MSIEISYKEELKRKAVHLSSLWMVAATLLLPYFFDYGRLISCVLFAALLLLTLFSEHSFANDGKYLGRLYGMLFGRMLRKEVHPGMWIVSGGAFVLAAALLVNLLFPPCIAAPSLAVMLTGDAQDSALAVAGAVGIREVYAGLLPQQKLERLQAIRQDKGAAMFVGDGINDAPVLAGADVGAAMGSGADAAIEAADVVFMTSDVEAVPQALRIARQTSQIAWQNVIFALGVKFLVMVLGLMGYASMWLAVFADSGVAMLCVLNSIRMLYKK